MGHLVPLYTEKHVQTFTSHLFPAGSSSGESARPQRLCDARHARTGCHVTRVLPWAWMGVPDGLQTARTRGSAPQAVLRTRAGSGTDCYIRYEWEHDTLINVEMLQVKQRLCFL